MPRLKLCFLITRYINGANKENIKIDMTAPVANMYIMKDDEVAQENSFMSFYIPEVHQENPPQPNNTDVKIFKDNGMVLYTRAFGSRGLFPRKKRVKEEFESLYKELKKAGITNINWRYPVLLGNK